MSDNLYDTGAPKRIIVEHRHTHEVNVTVPDRQVQCPYCQSWRNATEPRCLNANCKGHKVTITPEFQPVEEGKRLK